MSALVNDRHPPQEVFAMKIGERQTVQRAKHPALGEGRLVYDNGPAFFVADSGEVEQYTEAGWAGSGLGTREHYGQLPSRHRVLLDTTEREKGPSHLRIVTEDGRPGWLVTWHDKVSDRERFIWERFEPDGTGEHETMMVQTIWVGRAHEENSRKDIERRRQWRTLRTVGGHCFVFRREDDPAPARVEAPPTIPTLGTRKALRGPMPGPNASRAEIDAWRRSS